MIVLTFLACLATAETHCRTVELRPTNQSGQHMTMEQCTASLAPQEAIIEWMEDHPGWRIKGGWTCGAG